MKNTIISIADIGFMFEVSTTLKYNLISPDVLAFFDGVLESEEVNGDCAFPLAKPNTNLYQSIFQNVGCDWVVCSDGVFRKCPIVRCLINHNSIIRTEIFHIDRTICDENIAGFISL